MTEDEFNNSPLGQALLSFLVYMKGVVDLHTSFKGSWAFLYGVANFLSKLVKRPLAQELNQHDALLHALLIIGSWGAFEAYIADFCKAIMQMHPEFLESDDIKKVKVPVSDLLASSDEDKRDRIYAAIETGLGRKKGVDRFEDILKCADMSQGVPSVIKDAFYIAQQVRNVWAHHAGHADAEFIQNARHLGYHLNQQVALSNDETATYIFAIFMYGLIIANRYRLKNGLPPYPINQIGADHPVLDAYYDLYPSMQRPGSDTTPSGSDGPQ